MTYKEPCFTWYLLDVLEYLCLPEKTNFGDAQFFNGFSECSSRTSAWNLLIRFLKARDWNISKAHKIVIPLEFWFRREHDLFLRMQTLILSSKFTFLFCYFLSNDPLLMLCELLHLLWYSNLQKLIIPVDFYRGYTISQLIGLVLLFC